MSATIHWQPHATTQRTYIFGWLCWALGLATVCIIKAVNFEGTSNRRKNLKQLNFPQMFQKIPKPHTLPLCMWPMLQTYCQQPILITNTPTTTTSKQPQTTTNTPTNQNHLDNHTPTITLSQQPRPHYRWQLPHVITSQGLVGERSRGQTCKRQRLT